ncbi:MAG: DUF4190 domain-containing protein [Verrucomicrobiaceae bacterium]|nr:DUF4190 domain-containing protein [Verrucomicrobiaceae bacterium]
MSYQIARDGETIGHYSEDELVVAVENGSVLETDLAWTEGMDEWITVEELIEVEVIEEDEEDASVSSSASADEGAKPMLRPLGRPLPAASAEPPVERLRPAAPIPVRPTGPAHSTVHYASPVVPAAPPQPVAASPDRYGPPPPHRQPGNFYASIPAGHYGPAGSAIASLVLGILSVVFCCLTGVPAIICGHLARGKIRRSGGAFSGHGMATAGLVLGYVTTVISLLYGIAVLVGIGPSALEAFHKTAEDLRTGRSQIERVEPSR